MRYSSTVRFVDRYVGSIICFFFTLIHKLLPQSRTGKVKNILVIELVEMGASVMAYSSFKYIKEQIPDAEIFCLTTESTKEPWLLLENVRPENVFTLDNRSTLSLIFSIFKQTRALSKKNIDVVMDFELFTRVSAIIAFLVRSKFRAGFYGYTTGGLYRGNFLDVKCYFNQNLHISKNLLALTKSAVTLSRDYYNWNAPIPNDEIITPSYRSDPAILKIVQKKIKDSYSVYSSEPIIAIAPTVGKMLPMRDYPKEHYVEVIRMMLQKHKDHLFVLVGTSEHADVAEEIRTKIGDKRVINFAGHTANLRELLELFTIADVLISNDSGNPHFAAMAGLPTVALYGPETPFMYGPLGKAVCLFDFFHTSPSITTYNHKNPPSADNECLRSIRPSRVVEAAESILRGEAKYLTVNNEVPYLL